MISGECREIKGSLLRRFRLLLLDVGFQQEASQVKTAPFPCAQGSQQSHGHPLRFLTS